MVGNHPIGISNAAFYDSLYTGYNLSDSQLTQAITTLVEIQQNRNSSGGALKNEANAFKNNMTCPYGHPLIKKGRSKTGTQRYYCKICKRTYSGPLKTLAMYSKISQLTWGEFIQITTAKATLRQIATILHINKNTAWLEQHKLMDSLSDIQKSVILSGNIYIDEMYMTFRHMNDKKKRGISDQQYKIFVAVDDKGHSLIIPYGTGKATKADVFSIIMPHIFNGPNHIYTDQNNCYDELANAGMVVEMIKADVLDQKYKEKMKPINNFCSFVRGMIERTRGMVKRYLNDYCNLWYFIYTYARNAIPSEKIPEYLAKILSKSSEIKRQTLWNGRAREKHDYLTKDSKKCA